MNHSLIVWQSVRALAYQFAPLTMTLAELTDLWFGCGLNFYNQTGGSLNKRFQIRVFHCTRIKFVQSYRHFYDRSNKRVGINNSSPSESESTSAAAATLRFFSASQRVVEATISGTNTQTRSHTRTRDGGSYWTRQRRLYVLFIFINTYSKFAYRVTHPHTPLNGRSTWLLCTQRRRIIRCYPNCDKLFIVTFSCLKKKTCRTLEFFVTGTHRVYSLLNGLVM